MPSVLRVLTPPELQGEYRITQQVTTIGTSPGNNIQIDHPTVASVHASLIDEGGRYLLIDHSSRHGTFVDGVRIDKKRLEPGNRIKLGKHTELLFTFQAAESEPQADVQVIIATDRSGSPISDIQKKITLHEAGFEYQQELYRQHLEPQDQEKYLSAIYQVNQTITTIFDPRQLAEEVLDLIFQIFPLDRAAVILYDQERQSSYPVAFKSRWKTGKADPISISQTIVRKVILEKSAVLAKDTYLDDRFKDVSSITRKHIRSVMCVPLHTKGKILGALYTDSLQASGEFSEDDLRLLLAVAGALANSIENAWLVDRIKEDERKLSTLERYLPAVVVEHLFHEHESDKLGGRYASVSVLFADIRGFTSLAEQTAPSEVVNRLNDYFASMSDIVFEHGGTIGEYIGDEIMAYFGAPFESSDHAERTISVALKMMEAMKTLKLQWRNAGLPVFDIGIGIATGEVIAGNVGSIKQMKYTIIGNAVNLASRLCAYAAPGQILINSETYNCAGKPEKAIFLEKACLRGISEPVELYEIKQQPD
jgi:adenylate cyclase